MKRSRSVWPLGGLLILVTLALFTFSLVPTMFGIMMMPAETATCHLTPISIHLRGWLDPIPTTPAGSGALPPGVVPPTPQPLGPETHAINLELAIANASQVTQQVQVESWQWQQNQTPHPMTWEVQPDMSPLNHYSYVQRSPIQLQSRSPIHIKMMLKVNGQPCHLQLHLRP